MEQLRLLFQLVVAVAVAVLLLQLMLHFAVVCALLAIRKQTRLVRLLEIPYRNLLTDYYERR